VEADDLWNLTFVEMATNRVADFVVQACDAVGLREDRLPESPGCETRLQAAENLANSFQAITQDRDRFVPVANALKAQYAPRWNVYKALESRSGYLEYAGEDLRAKVTHSKVVQTISADNEKLVIQQFMGHMLRDYAHNVAKDRLIRSLEKMLNVSGLKHVPLNNEDAIYQMAVAGRKVLVPYDRFQREWGAVVKVQQQTLNLIEVSEEHMKRAAQLAAQGSPAEMQSYLDKVFRHVELETTEYMNTVGAAYRPDDSSVELFTKPLDQYIAFRRSRSRE